MSEQEPNSTGAPHEPLQQGGDPTVEVPAPGRLPSTSPSNTQVPEATAAIDDSEDESTREAVSRLGHQLQPSLQLFEGHSLADFKWKAPDGSTHACSAQLQAVTGRVDAYKTTAIIRLVASTGTTKSFKLGISPYCDKAGSLRLRVQGAGRIRDWELLKGGAVKDWLEGEEDLSSVYPYPKNMPGLEYFGRFWFSSDDLREHNVQIRRGKPAGPPVAKDLRDGWPEFSSHGEKKLRWRVPLHRPGEENTANMQWGARVLSFCLWSVLLAVLEAAEEDDEVSLSTRLDLPTAQQYFPGRPVDLRTDKVYSDLRESTPDSPERLQLPWHVLEAACAALNAGKNVIFTGPPGCGKSKLAVALARIATRKPPLVATASPAWTSGDLIGRYVPERSGRGLEFHAGHFLRAVESDRWLVVDEFNRANIDECFGELFSVLAGDIVELPYRAPLDVETGEGTAGGLSQSPEDSSDGVVRIVPHGRGGATDADERFCDYQVSPAFRLIGTMNDADRASLHQLSFALQRRFHIIRVQAPEPKVVAEIIDEALNRQFNADECYQFRHTKRAMPANEGKIRDCLKALFADEHPESLQPDGKVFGDLVSERVVGVATVLDVLHLVLEGLRSPSDPGEKKVVELDTAGQADAKTKIDSTQLARYVTASYVALGVALSVFPQFESLRDDGDLERAIAHTLKPFRENDNSLPFLRLQRSDRSDAEGATFLAVRERPGGQMLDQDGDSFISIPEFLISELRRQFAGTGRDEIFDRLIAKEPHRN